MKFVCAQPAIDYYAWQVEVMILNFIRNGVNANDIHIVCGYYGSVPERWRTLANTYNYVCFFFYPDDRPKNGYIPSIRPYILHKHWIARPELANETVFYHDSDIILSKPFTFHHLSEGETCYVADTVSYIGANYIRSKGEHYLDIMTSIVGVDKQLVIDNEKDSGGAQYIIKGVDALFWETMYHDVEEMYTTVNQMIAEDKAKDPSHHEIQIWCADMWCLLWGLWKRGKEVKVTQELSFSWGTSNIEQWDMHNIFHNAGVTHDRANELFYKGAYIHALPFDDVVNKTYSDKFCSIKYVEEILKTREVTCLK
jgi:hypothetical protein